MNNILDSTLNAHILIVDDNQQNVSLLEMMLSFSGYTNVQSTTDSREVLELYLNNKFDLILLDIRMPHLDGFQVIEQLTQVSQGDYLPVLVLTAQEDQKTRLQALEAGASDFVTKPFDRTEVLFRIVNILKIRLIYNERNEMTQILERKVNERTRELHNTQLMIIQRLGRAGEYRDNETGMHVIRMSHSSQRLALAAGLGESLANLIFTASPMHDVGKIGIPDAILLKPGRLDQKEFEVMKTHAQIGADIIGRPDVDLMKMAHAIALTHHEKWDGSGYPKGLKGEAIPIEGRISAVCDVFDALTSERPYKKAWPVEKAMALINEGAGQHFEPRMVQLFNQILPVVQDIGRQYSDACEQPTSPGIQIASERVAFNGDYLTGNEDIDNQHRKIFDIINNTHNAIIDGDIYLCEKLFYSFNKTVAEHLQSEERILAKSQYPHLAEHCVFHRELLARTENIAGKCKDMQDKAGLLKCFDELIQFFINDVMRDDLDFKLHLQETGFANK